MCKKCKSAARLGYAINNCGREWQKIHAPVRTHHCEHGEPHRRERTAEAGGRSAEPRCRWAALEIGSRARCWAPEQPLLPSTAEPRRSAAVKRTRAPMCTQPIRGCGRLLAHAPRLASVAAGWAGLQRRRRGGGAAPLWAPGRARPRGGRARCRWCALPAGAAPPPSSPPALLGRRGAGRRRSGGSSSRAASVASMSSSRAKKVKMATKSCPECDQQVRRGVARRGAGAALSCPVPSCPVLSAVPRLAPGRFALSARVLGARRRLAGTAALPLGLWLRAGRAAGVRGFDAASVPPAPRLGVQRGRCPCRGFPLSPAALPVFCQLLSPVAVSRCTCCRIRVCDGNARSCWLSCLVFRKEEDLHRL